MLKYLPLLLVLGLIVYCFIDVLTTDRRRFRSAGKTVWLMITLLPVVGAALWLFRGRSRHKGVAPGDSIIHLRRAPRQVAPDDDPEFIKELDQRAWRARREAAHPLSAAARGKAEETDPKPAAGGSPPADESDGSNPPAVAQSGPAVGEGDDPAADAVAGAEPADTEPVQTTEAGQGPSTDESAGTGADEGSDPTPK